MKIRNEVAAAKRYLSKIAKAKPDSWKNEQHLAQAGALLARFGLSAKGYNPEVKTKTLAEYILETNDKYDNMDIAGSIDLKKTMRLIYLTATKRLLICILIRLVFLNAYFHFNDTAVAYDI
mgnify:CR=1 FL=1